MQGLGKDHAATQVAHTAPHHKVLTVGLTQTNRPREDHRVLSLTTMMGGGTGGYEDAYDWLPFIFADD
jgi:hypothetical protein